MCFVLCRAAQWGLPTLVLVFWGSINPILVLAMIAAAWGAKRRADQILALGIAHVNMLAYIRRGGLENSYRPIILPGEERE